MNDSRLRKIYKEKAGRDWDEEGPYSSMSETEFVEAVKELIKKRDELIREAIGFLEYFTQFNATKKKATEWLKKAERIKRS